MLTQLPHLPAASANALTGTRTLGAAPSPGKAAHRKAANELHADNDRLGSVPAQRVAGLELLKAAA
jgi:hypothetical protein